MSAGHTVKQCHVFPLPFVYQWLMVVVIGFKQVTISDGDDQPRGSSPSSMDMRSSMFHVCFAANSEQWTTTASLMTSSTILCYKRVGCIVGRKMILEITSGRNSGLLFMNSV